MAGGEATSARIVENRERQRELYGAPLGERVRRITGALGISQARLARTLGISPAMLSQLVSARRVKIGDPAVLARLLLLDQRCRGLPPPIDRGVVDGLLAEVAEARWQWNAGPGPRGPRREGPRPVVHRGVSAAAVLRRVSDPARLAAAAAALGPAFPELAEVLRQAASRPGG
ncbi:MAG TPA: XRE family transcriptional regulator [Pseudonocardia sp.]|jgi:transcriptional regulator with XRE-family HTH domain|uniref:XRE family transcriptional regulator n=1 Tax=Pseudonocardia sp. TaxID=60912 RepID=UPI002B4B6BA2|nr:XRE family transcriptional regulator [Pseudonocardia sp.]HLU54672.1 XRE family transcriptional regulator [Pseudonocardia sp.]